MSELNRTLRPWLLGPLMRAYRELKNDPEAANEVLTRSADQNPNDPQVLALLAGHKFNVGQFAEAASLFLKVVELTGPDKTLYTALAACQERLHLFETAIVWRERIAREFPPSPYNAHLLRGLHGDFEPRASAGALRELYDELAPAWDRQYVRDRGFRLAAEGLNLLEATEVDLHEAVVLDLGCGTGAVGTALASRGATVYGVDLSNEMLSAARVKDVYSGLMSADLEDFLEAPTKFSPVESWDLVVALDVFIHFDDLEKIFKAVRGLCQVDSHFLLTVRHDATISPTTRFTRFGKYVHSHEEVAHWLATAGFFLLESQACVVYRWSQYTVHGSIFVARAQ